MSLFPEIDQEIQQIKEAEKAIIKKIKENSEKYMPSNGTEGCIFEENYCAKCSKENTEKEQYCSILTGLVCGNKHVDLIEYKKTIVCFQHSAFNVKEFLKGIS